MKVRVRDRGSESSWGSGPTHPVVCTLTIADQCPECGEPRGEPQPLRQCDDGAWYTVDTWDNPCGHQDTYVAVLKEV